MANVPLASFEELVAAARGDIGDDDEVWVEALLTRVSAKAREEARRTWLDDSGALANVPESVWAVVIDACLRLIAPTPGVVSDGVETSTVRYDADSARGVFFTDDELKILRRNRPQARPGLASVPVSGGAIMYPVSADGEVTVYLNVSGGYGTAVKVW